MAGLWQKTEKMVADSRDSLERVMNAQIETDLNALTNQMNIRLRDQNQSLVTQLNDTNEELRVNLQNQIERAIAGVSADTSGHVDQISKAHVDRLQGRLEQIEAMMDDTRRGISVKV